MLCKMLSKCELSFKFLMEINEAFQFYTLLKKIKLNVDNVDTNFNHSIDANMAAKNTKNKPAIYLVYVLDIVITQIVIKKVIITLRRTYRRL